MKHGKRKRRPPSPPPSSSPGEAQYLAFVDGSLKGEDGSASAVLLAKGSRRALCRGSLAYSGARASWESEVRGFLLALLMAPRGSRLRVETDFAPLAQVWRGGRGEGYAGSLAPFLEAARVLARALEVEVEVEKVPRKAVEEAHREAGAAREERRLEEEKAARAYGFLSRLPARYRKAALEVLERYPGDGRDLLAWLGEGVSPTRDLLRQALGPLREREVRELLQGIREMDGSLREALKGYDRREAWAEKPPTEKQLALLEALGYRGPAPRSVLEASELIESLQSRKGRRA